MIRRLLLALLAFCLALPAAAAPALHCAPAGVAAASGHHGHSQHRREDPPRHAQPTAHDCIGCIAPLAGAAPSADAERLAAAPPEARAAAPIVGRVSGPDTPPPRA